VEPNPAQHTDISAIYDSQAGSGGTEGADVLLGFENTSNN
jgi:hypothetical protein